MSKLNFNTNNMSCCFDPCKAGLSIPTSGAAANPLTLIYKGIDGCLLSGPLNSLAIPTGIINNGTSFLTLVGFNSAGNLVQQNVTNCTLGAIIPIGTGSNTNLVSVSGGCLIRSSLSSLTTNTLTWTQASNLSSNVNGITSTVSIPSGTINTVLGYNSAGTPVYQLLSTLLPTPATVVPLQDGFVTCRNGQVGTSTQYARQDHSHPIVAKTITTLPTPVIGGLFTLVGTVGTTLQRATNQTLKFIQFFQLNTTAVGTWGTINLPTSLNSGGCNYRLVSSNITYYSPTNAAAGIATAPTFDVNSMSPGISTYNNAGQYYSEIATAGRSVYVTVQYEYYLV